MSRVRSAAKVAVSENTACYENLANAIILRRSRIISGHFTGWVPIQRTGMRCTRKKDWNDSFTLRGMRRLQIWMQTA